MKAETRGYVTIGMMIYVLVSAINLIKALLLPEDNISNFNIPYLIGELVLFLLISFVIGKCVFTLSKWEQEDRDKHSQ